MIEDLKKALKTAQIVKATNQALITELEDEILNIKQVVADTTKFISSIEKQLEEKGND